MVELVLEFIGSVVIFIQTSYTEGCLFYRSVVVTVLPSRAHPLQMCCLWAFPSSASLAALYG